MEKRSQVALPELGISKCLKSFMTLGWRSSQGTSMMSTLQTPWLGICGRSVAFAPRSSVRASCCAPAPASAHPAPAHVACLLGSDHGVQNTCGSAPAAPLFMLQMFCSGDQIFALNSQQVRRIDTIYHLMLLSHLLSLQNCNLVADTGSCA